MCSCILTKLIMDAWLRSGPAVVLPLVLRMLQKALANPSTTIKARAFDLLYNLSVHAALLLEAVDHQQPHAGAHSAHSSIAYGQPSGPFSPRDAAAAGGYAGASSPRSASQPLSPRVGVGVHRAV
jgi:hypothetical protein